MFLPDHENLSLSILKWNNGLLEWCTKLGRVNILNYMSAFGSVCSGDLIFLLLRFFSFRFLLVFFLHILWNFGWDLDQIRWGFAHPGLRKDDPADGRGDLEPDDF